MTEKINLKNYLLPGRIRKKDGYYHLIIDTIIHACLLKQQTA